MIPEQLRNTISDRLGDQPITFNREQTTILLVSLAANLQQLLNDNQRLPLVQANIQQHDNGFTLHVNIIQPTTNTDIEL